MTKRKTSRGNGEGCGYGVDRSDVEYIMDSFTIVKAKEEREHGEYRTKRVILERLAAFDRAIESGAPYDPPRVGPPTLYNPNRQWDCANHCWRPATPEEVDQALAEHARRMDEWRANGGRLTDPVIKPGLRIVTTEGGDDDAA